MKNFSSIWLISVFLLFFCQAEKAEQSNSKIIQPIRVKYDSLSQTKQFSIKDSTGSYIFEVYLQELNKGIIRYRYNGDEPLNKQIKPMKKLLTSIFSDSSLNIDFTTLQWGRLNSSEKRDYTLAKRIVLAAAKSDGWNKELGKPVEGHENHYVQNLANRYIIYPELIHLFYGFGYKIKISGVEKVLVQQAGKLAFWNDISDQVNSDDKLPIDCQTWFKIEEISFNE